MYVIDLKQTPSKINSVTCLYVAASEYLLLLLSTFYSIHGCRLHLLRRSDNFSLVEPLNEYTK